MPKDASASPQCRGPPRGWRSDVPGRARLGEVRRSLASAEARLLADLTDGDAEQLRALLSRVAQAAQRELVAPDEMKC